MASFYIRYQADGPDLWEINGSRHSILRRRVKPPQLLSQLPSDWREAKIRGRKAARARDNCEILKTMLHLITTLFFLLQTNISGTRAQVIFKRQVFGFDSSGQQLRANNDNNEDNSDEFLNQGMILKI